MADPHPGTKIEPLVKVEVTAEGKAIGGEKGKVTNSCKFIRRESKSS